ncbi:hypothetical protein HERIO_285 [Hepatospora eriocheir]|uniref:Uncharacterized protein n=1 Tax=Hepatospora eriocheir TaxID=1081669 RepID=A0A1X0QDM4_9MICR|nr:hypothetical protein HERIO_285 [Hepatospora eriocheir]
MTLNKVFGLFHGDEKCNNVYCESSPSTANYNNFLLKTVLLKLITICYRWFFINHCNKFNNSRVLP